MMTGSILVEAVDISHHLRDLMLDLPNGQMPNIHHQRCLTVGFKLSVLMV
jgi:hypothetical protein